ncbi:putative transcriptional regulator, LysR family (plasmid) [Ralstonia solanacearum PSI07]|nr:putative transcriptional regulator, LysR family [Ralstonia solanacearum PSI07]
MGNNVPPLFVLFARLAPLERPAMNLRFLETFVWVARLRSFRLTADKLFTTQASISARIAALEDELGVRLFDRDTRGVQLTPDGHKVLEYADRMVSTLHQMQAAVAQRPGFEGRVRVGAMDSVIHTWLSPLIARTAEMFPALEIELVADSAMHLAEQLQKGSLDIAFQTDLLRAESVRNVELVRYPIHWVVAANSRLARPYAGLADLAQERLITFVRNSRPHQDMLNLLHLNGVVSPRINCVNSVAAMTRLVGDGFGVGALPTLLVRDRIEGGALTVLDIEPRLPPLPVIASWRTGAGLDVHEAIVGLARTMARELCLSVGPRYAVVDPEPAAAA